MQSQQIFTLGSLSISSENYGFTAEPVSEVPMLGLGMQYTAATLDIGNTICVKQIVCSEKQLYILSAKGEVFMMDSEITSEQQPSLFEGFGNVPVIQLAGHCEGKHMMALNADRQVFSWGFGEGGRLGHGDLTPRAVPTRIQYFTDNAIARIYCGAAYSAAVSIIGVLYTWGRGFYGSLGHGSSEDKLIPTSVQALTGHAVVDVALGSGDSHSLCVTEAGLVFAWGDNDFGKLGNGTCKGSHLPVQIESLSLISRVFSGSQFSVALAYDGSVYTWGKCHGGRLGHQCENLDERIASKSEPEYCYEPKKLEALYGNIIVDMAVGSAHCLALTNNGEVYGWGRNDFHQICPLSMSRDSIIAVPILTTPSAMRITGIACGPAQSILWRHSSVTGVAPRIPFVVDLTEPTFRFIDQLLGIVCGGSLSSVTSGGQSTTSEESECIAVGSLNLLRLQLHALITNNIDPHTVGLGEGSRLLTSLKTRILALAGGPTTLKTMQDSAQWTLQVGWSVFLPTASERAQTLTALLPSEPGVSTSGHRFMTDLLVSSLMAEEGLQTALKQAINAEPEDSSSGHNLPLLHLIKQLLRNNSALTQARLGQLLVESSLKIDDNYFPPEPPSPSLDLLHRFQR